MQSSVELIDERDTYGKTSKTTQLRFTLSDEPTGVPAHIMMGTLQSMLLAFMDAYGRPRARVFVQDGLVTITIKGAVDDPTELRRMIEEEIVHIRKKTANSYTFFKLCLAEIGGQVVDLQRVSSYTTERLEQVKDTLTELDLRVEDISQGLDTLLHPVLPAPVTVTTSVPAVKKTSAVGKASAGKGFSLRKLWSS